jgi:gamma-glutamyltranspeptidase / glutathione hydrolase
MLKRALLLLVVLACLAGCAAQREQPAPPEAVPAASAPTAPVPPVTSPAASPAAAPAAEPSATPASPPGAPPAAAAPAVVEAAAPAAASLPPPQPAPKLGLFHRRQKGQAWVAAANPLAVDAGLEILAKGGNAIDAAVAVQTMLGLVEPQSSGIAGGSFLMYYDARTHEVSALDGREKAPAAAPANMFLDEHGKPLPFLEAVRSGRSTGVPGAIAMLYAAHSKFGSLHWKDLFQPAIRAAAQGFRVPERLASFLGEGSPFPPTSEIRSLFSRPSGEPLEADDIFRNPE